MKKLKVYIAGKVSPDSVFGTHDWRDAFCQKLGDLVDMEIINLDPTKTDENFHLDKNNSELVFGRDSFMIKSSDLVIVNLTDDISVGGSQEMLIAKYYHKPLVGLAPLGGKFHKQEAEIMGKKYKNWVHVFVAVPCDTVVPDIEGAAEFIKNFFSKDGTPVKTIGIIDAAVKYYEDNFYERDEFMKNI